MFSPIFYLYPPGILHAIVYFYLFSSKVEDDGDIQELVISFTGLEEKVIEQYTLAKVRENLCWLDSEEC